MFEIETFETFATVFAVCQRHPPYEDYYGVEYCASHARPFHIISLERPEGSTWGSKTTIHGLVSSPLCPPLCPIKETARLCPLKAVANVAAAFARAVIAEALLRGEDYLDLMDSINFHVMILSVRPMGLNVLGYQSHLQ